MECVAAAALCLVPAASLVPVRAAAVAATVSIDTAHPGHAVSPMLWGIFFEEINLAGDGGIYAELVRNRSFEDAEKPEHWKLLPDDGADAAMEIDSATPLNPLNRRSLRLQVRGAGRAALVNEGYWGIPLQSGAQYGLRFEARATTNFVGLITVELQDPAGNVCASRAFNDVTPSWKSFAGTLTSDTTIPEGRLVLRVNGPATVWFDMVSLFPEASRLWKGRGGGFRSDLMQMLDGLKPAFLRFPGGCWVEGHDLEHAYRWKETIGDIAHRRTQYNLWQYQSTHGLGYHEYLQLCEDLGAEPLLVINCGMSHTEVVPLDQMGPWVQDALDAIEYANGPTNSLWGSFRARSGHPAPFGLKYLEIGNENGGPAYHERYALFYDALKARYPEIHLIANEWGGTPKTRPVEMVDEHYYSSPEFFIRQADRYDRYDRQGPKIYVGEYAVTAGCGQGNLRAAVGEAAFMTGMERNSDVVVMSSYAPLFANVNYKKWNPDLINFDNHRVCGTPSYYVQQMFACNRGDVVLPVRITVPQTPREQTQPGRIGLGTWLTQAEYKDLRVTQGNQVLYASDFARSIADWQTRGGQWSVVDGAFRQSASTENVQAVVGDAGWSDYTYTLKARKLGGAEGFLVMFQVRDDQNWLWWNLGGWGNQRHAIERCENGGKSILGKEVNGRIETGRWYDVRIELRGLKIRCYLDDELIHEVEHPELRPWFASATLDRVSGDSIVKLVNASAEDIACTIEWQGARPTGTARLQLLSGSTPMEENTLSDPLRVSPRTLGVPVKDGRLEHRFPGNSVSVIRMGLAVGRAGGSRQ